MSKNQNINESKQFIINQLQMIYDDVKWVKGTDRFVVKVNSLYGLVDSNGKCIIPVSYARITAKKNLVKAYESIGYNQNQLFLDYDGNKLTETCPFTREIKLGKFGILVGHSVYAPRLDNCNYTTYIISYRFGVRTIETREVRQIQFNSKLPELLLLDNGDKVNGWKCIRLDRGLDIIQPKDAFDEQVDIDNFDFTKQDKRTRRIESDANITFIESLCKSFKCKKSDLRLVRIKNGFLVVDKNYRPLSFIGNNNTIKMNIVKQTEDYSYV